MAAPVPPKTKAKVAATKAKKKPAVPAKTTCAACNSRCAALYEKYKKKLADTKDKLTKAQQADLKKFQANYVAHLAQYQAVAADTGVPAPLVAAIHWRESGGNFNTYLAQGDPLGKPPVHIPNDGPTYQKGEWDKAADEALDEKGNKACQAALGMTKDTTDRAAMAAYAESYNGLGYDNKGVPDPYVLSGTDGYTSGKYVADRVYSPTAVDGQLGVMPMIDSITPSPYLDSTLIPPKNSDLYVPASSSSTA